MPFNFRQKTDTVKIIRNVVLCMAVMALAGFSKPAPLGDGNSSVTRKLWEVEQPVVFIKEPTALQNNVSAKPLIAVPVRRLASFVTEALLDPVLGEVSYREWASPGRYSPDRVLADLQSPMPERFYGVGFPDIRTHDKKVHLVSFTPDVVSNWNPMITWRDSAQEGQLQEPIAHVRCMGLSPQSVARRADRFESLILETSLEYDVSVSLIKAIVTEESCFNSQAVSPVGALGLMQLMPDTAQWLKVKNPLDPMDNLRAGVRYIAALQEQFDTLELALAAYNAGPGNVRRYKGVPPFAETQAYVQKVQAHYRRYVAATQLASR
ncbi:lytic transglycosylase domain-containing protein [Granulosicoccus antarcticus]|uniref:Soluble lytic murein transglycosylase n=1 Tax=Granulosicoccus antarcticus IMCC3135 TaxID=1192854 RepID=A0A2Z2P5B3_9GAMM|nr:lytic transglycosylase domain-containing protein [Granulosicoccus antarcticus]ASJ75024.1 Soluble lytic murein transglycosylase [Granulosicoccus antarcticus IMCC3135]